MKNIDLEIHLKDGQIVFCDIPEGTRLFVRDYNKERYYAEDLQEDKYGREHFLSVLEYDSDEFFKESFPEHNNTKEKGK
jgi:hypothetical protein